MSDKFELVSENQLEEIDGGIAVGTAVLIGCGVVLVVGAGVSFFNGYSDAAGK